MTEIPEHLLARSRARREAAGLAALARRRGRQAGGRASRSSRHRRDARRTRRRPRRRPHRPHRRPRPRRRPSPIRPTSQAYKRRRKIPFWVMPVAPGAAALGLHLRQHAREAAGRRRPARSPTARRSTHEVRDAATAPTASGGVGPSFNERRGARRPSRTSRRPDPVGLARLGAGWPGDDLRRAEQAERSRRHADVR